MAGHGSSPPEDQANHPGRRVDRPAPNATFSSPGGFGGVDPAYEYGSAEQDKAEEDWASGYEAGRAGSGRAISATPEWRAGYHRAVHGYVGSKDG